MKAHTRGYAMVELLIVVGVLVVALGFMVERSQRVNVEQRSQRGAALLTTAATLMAQQFPNGYGTYVAADGWALMPIELRGVSPAFNGRELGENATLTLTVGTVTGLLSDSLRFRVGGLTQPECVSLTALMSPHFDRFDINGRRMGAERGVVIRASIITTNCALATPAILDGHIL